MATGKKTAAKREEVALGLACGGTVRCVAADCHVSERTVQNWLAEADFAQRVEQLRSEMTEQAMSRLIARMTSAADVLGALLQDGDPRIRLRASVALLEQAVRLREVTVFEERLRLLEQAEQRRQERKRQ